MGGNHCGKNSDVKKLAQIKWKLRGAAQNLCVLVDLVVLRFMDARPPCAPKQNIAVKPTLVA